jgi:hypothetical protein
VSDPGPAPKRSQPVSRKQQSNIIPESTGEIVSLYFHLNDILPATDKWTRLESVLMHAPCLKTASVMNRCVVSEKCMVSLSMLVQPSTVNLHLLRSKSCATLRQKPGHEENRRCSSSVSRIMLYAGGESKLTNHLVNRQAISNTLLENRESCVDRPSFSRIGVGECHLRIVNDEQFRRASIVSLEERCYYCSKTLAAYPLIMSDDTDQTVYHAMCAVELATEIMVDLYTFFSPPAPVSHWCSMPGYSSGFFPRGVARLPRPSAARVAFK